MSERKRETAAERDERIVREHGRWNVMLDADAGYVLNPYESDDYVTALGAAARILNRIARKRGGKGKA